MANIPRIASGGGTKYIECCVLSTEHDRGDSLFIFDSQLKNVQYGRLSQYASFTSECFVPSYPGNGSWACTAKVNGHFVGYDDTGHKYIDKDCVIGENLLAGVNAQITAVIFCTKIFSN